MRPMTAAPHAKRTGLMLRPRLGGLVQFYLHLAGFTASTLLMTWGLFALLFIALGGFSLDGMMHQLHNLSSRYVTADGDRIASFRHIFLTAHLIISGGLVVLRHKHILPPDLFGKDSVNG